jgi:TP901 family phage tail tape measure protein
MGSSIIGQLRVILGLDTAQFEAGLTDAEKTLRKKTRAWNKLGDELSGIGKSLSLAITAPAVTAGAAVLKMAGDFEASMNRVGISTKAGAADMKAMSDLALQLGKDTTFSASEASDAMDMLAKNGLTAKQILGGAAKASLDLAAAAGSELDPAAAAITDTMANFKMTTADLPKVINQITGAVNESKLDFADFQKAMGSAAGVAGASGVSFQDFATVLAATSSRFSSGEDAGTSFKTFLTTLVPKSKEAAAAMEKYGLTFYDASGRIKSMADIAGMLQQKLGGLSDKARTDVMSTIFGTDAMRTAIGLMDQGAAGMMKVEAAIKSTDAAAQSAARLKGFNGQLEQLKGSVETLAIKVGQSGMLAAVTELVVSAGNLVDRLSELSPATLKMTTVVVALGAGIGPVVVGMGMIASSIGTLLPIVVSLGTFFRGTLVPILATVGRSLIGLAIAGGPLTLIAAAATAAYLAWQNWDSIGPIVARMYAAVKTWLVDKLGSVMKWVSDKAKAVGDAFFQLYDRVVGHSYVPDMVDEIGQHMARLQQNMVQPATKATQSAAEAFRVLEQQVAPILDRLFPQQAAANRFETEMAALEAYAKKAKWTADQLEEAKGRLRRDAGGLSPDGGTTGEISEPDTESKTTVTVENTAKTVEDAWARVRAANDNTVESFAGLARDVIGSLQSFANNIRSGDWLGALQGVLDIIGQVAGIIKGTGVPATRTYSTGGSSVPPGFKTGGSFKVGGMSGIDKNLVQFRATKGEMVNITKGGNDAGPVQRVVIVPSRYFDAAAADAAQPNINSMGVRAAAGGSSMAQTSMAKQQRRKIVR